MLFRHLAFEVIQNCSRCGESEGQLLFRCRAGLLQMVRADVHRVPFGQVRARVGGDVGNHPQGGFWWANICASAQIFFDYIILHRALQRAHIGALLISYGNIERQQPRRGGIYGHGGVHLIKWDVGKERAHISQMADGNTDFTHFSTRQDMVAVIARLCRQIEGHGQAGLPFGEIG